ncbi:MAG: PEGA domain-containing protein [Nitrospinae bacterium]|nr:PEGA domain-containing protein [Nitrospinota bacterium]
MIRLAAVCLALLLCVTLPVYAEEKAAEEGAQAKVEKEPAKQAKAEAAKPATAKKSTKKSKTKKSAPKAEEAKKAEPAPAKPETAEVASGGGAESTVNLKTRPKEGEAAATLAPTPYMIRKVSVLVESNPSGCDIEVDGVFIGVTPLEVTLKEGVHGVKISREGFLPWEKAVKAYSGLYINPSLVQESTKKRDVTESVKVK